MKFFSRSIFALAVALVATFTTQAQTYYYVGGDAASVTFNAATVWSTTLGGAPVAVVPSATTNFIIDGDDVSNASGLQPGTTMTLNLGANTTINNLTVIHNNVNPTIYGVNYNITTNDITVNSGCTLTNKTVIKVNGNLVNDGTLAYDANAGEYTFQGVNKTISGNGTTNFRKFTVATGAYTTLQRDIGISGALVSFVNGTLDAATYLITEVGNITSSISLVGTLRTSNLTGVRGVTGATVDPNVTLTMQTGNTIEFYAPSGIQQVWCGNSSVYYNNIIIAGGGTKRLVNGSATWIDIRGSLTINSGATLDVSATGDATNIKNIEFAANFTNNGTFTARTGEVMVAGSGTQVLTMNGSNLYDLELANPTTDGTSLGSDATLTHNVIFTNGRLLIGNYNFTFGVNAGYTGTPTNLKMIVTNGNGEVKKIIPSGGQSFTYPIGENTSVGEYSPVTLNFTSNAAERTFGARVVDMQHPNDGTVTSYISRYWHFSETSAPGSYTYDATFTFLAADLVGAFAPMSASYIYLPNTTWIGHTSTNTGTSIAATGLTQASAALSGAEVTGRVTAGCTPPNQPAAFTASTATVCAGQQGVTYTVPNDPSVTYTWSYSGANTTIVGTGNSVTLNFAANATGGTLSVVANNVCASAPRTIAITVGQAIGTPIFTTGATTLCVGGTSTYTATAANSSSIAYSIVGNTGATINTNTGAVSNVTGNFTVQAIATGPCGTPTAGTQAVTITPSVQTPVFTAGPTTLCVGGSATYTAIATNSTGIVYSIVGGTGANINSNTGVVSNVTGNFTVRATASGTCGTPTTVDVVVTVTPFVGTPTFTAGPTTLCTGGVGTYTATASNSSGITYSIVGNTGASINTNTGVVSNVTGNFTVRATATGTCGNPTTVDRLVTVTNSLTISQQPQSVDACFNSQVTFTVVAGGSNMQYQWQLDGVDIPNATSASYTVNGVNLTNDGDYTVNITSSCGNATSQVATLTQIPVIVTVISEDICKGTTYNFNGELLSIADTYYDTLTAVSSCDSIVMLNLTVSGPTAVVTQTNNVNLSTDAQSAYQWLLNGAPINGANAQTYVAAAEGQYAVIVTDANGCKDTSAAVTVQPVSINEEFASFSIYPNPTNGVVYIKAENLPAGKLVYSLSDITGRMLTQQTIAAKGSLNQTLDISGFTPGLYLLTISNSKGTYQTYKLIKAE